MPGLKRKLHRRQATERVPDNMGRLPSRLIEQSQTIVGHLLNGQLRAHGLTASNTAIVKAEAGVMLGQGLNLRVRGKAQRSNALNHEQRRTAALDSVTEATPPIVKPRRA